MIERVLEDHTPWARAVFSEGTIWMACSCGWNVHRDAYGTWNEHFLAAAAEAIEGLPITRSATDNYVSRAALLRHPEGTHDAE